MNKKMKWISQATVVIALLAEVVAAGATVRLGPDGKPLPFRNDEEITEFLRSAKVVSQKPVDIGTNGIYVVLLEKDGVQMHAAFRDFRIKKRNHKTPDGTFHFNFRDDCVFELAAYKLSQLLGLNNVPPVVKRKINGKTGTLQMWLENAMMEKKRAKEKIPAPHKLQWIYQWQVIYVFDNLIYNEDRNQGNILIDSNWKLWMIDHSRAFRSHKQLRNPQIARYCSRQLWERLKTLDKDLIKKEFQGILRKAEIESLLARRDLLVQHIQNLIDQKGAGGVLF